MFTIFVCSAFIRVNIKQTEGSCLMNKAQKDSHVDTLNSTWQLSLNTVMKMHNEILI